MASSQILFPVKHYQQLFLIPPKLRLFLIPSDYLPLIVMGYFRCEWICAITFHQHFQFSSSWCLLILDFHFEEFLLQFFILQLLAFLLNCFIRIQLPIYPFMIPSHLKRIPHPSFLRKGPYQAS
jgi:hypothetical protein